MTPPVKLAAFAAVLALTFGGAALAGGAIGPAPTVDRAAHGGTAEHGSASGEHADAGHEAVRPVRGLAVSDDGLRLVLQDPELRRDEAEQLRFRIVRPSGETVRDFNVEHARRMHLIIARRDLTGFQHLHPRQRADGSWTVGLTIAEAGSHRLFADFSPEERPFTLASDLRVDGRADLRELPAPAAKADAGDGYTVELDSGAARAGEPARLRFSVSRDSRRVDVDPYLGADGHLVALREGDMAFLHVHPTDKSGSEARSIGFETTLPTPGRYRLFLQFKHEGRVHTAAFTQEVEQP